jgi:hypothetical protein
LVRLGGVAGAASIARTAVRTFSATTSSDEVSIPCNAQVLCPQCINSGINRSQSIVADGYSLPSRAMWRGM